MSLRKSYLGLILLTLTQTGLSAADLRVNVTNAAGDLLSNAVVYLEPETRRDFEVPPEQEIIDQINKEFAPKIKVVTKGSIVSFPNKDDISHHVYSFSDAKQFELPLYQGQTAPPVEFDKTGVVSLGCNIHDWMKGYVIVVDTPYFAKTDVNGAASFSDLPADSYQIKVWHPRSRQAMLSQKLELQVDASESIDIAIELKSAIKKRRSPRGRGRRY